MQTDDRLQFGAVALVSAGAQEGLPYVIDAVAGSEFGNAQAVITELASRLRDGSLSSVDSYGNRTAPIELLVTSDTYDGLGAAESALAAETRRPGYNTLTWTPSLALAVPTVFDVIYATLDWKFDDLSEVRLERYFTLTLACLPFPRSAVEVVAESLGPPGSATITSINDGSSTTGWSKQADATLASTGGKIVVTGSIVSGVTTGGFGDDDLPWAQYAPSSPPYSMAGDRYAFVDWQGEASGKIVGVVGIQATFDGEPVDGRAASIAAPAAGYTRTYFLAPASWSTMRVTPTLDYLPTGTTEVTLRIDQVSRTDAIGEQSTGRQQFRSLPVAGTVRTQGRLSVEHEEDSLGQCLAYVYCDDGSGYSPPLRRWLVSSSTTHDDATTVSGHWNTLDDPWVTETPARAVPDGNYRIYALLRGSAPGTVDLQVKATTVIGDNPLPGEETEVGAVTLTTDWGIYDITGLTLAPTKLAAPETSDDAVVRIEVTDMGATDLELSIEVDEVWVVNLDIGGPTFVDCSSKNSDTPEPGGASNRLWLDPATVTNDGQDAIYVGFSDDRSDAYSPADNIRGWTPPVFEPGSMNAFVVSTVAAFPAIRLAHFPRWLHNARAVD